MRNALIQILIALPLVIVSFQNCENPVAMNAIDKQQVDILDDNESLVTEEQNDLDVPPSYVDDSNEALGEEQICQHDEPESEPSDEGTTSQQEELVMDNSNDQSDAEEDPPQQNGREIANDRQDVPGQDSNHGDHQDNVPKDEDPDEHFALHEICETGDVEAAPFDGNFVGKCYVCHIPSGDHSKAKLIRVGAEGAKNGHTKNHSEDFVVKCGV